MSLEYFEGPAGCGKTYQLVEALKAAVMKQSLLKEEAVLGLTYMHGSRRRMHGRLAKIGTLRGRFLACTVDSLVRRIVSRWRTIARVTDSQLDMNASPDFERACRVAACLLAKPMVAAWLKNRYPVVVVDELQDCKGNRLGIIQALESYCHVIAAADEFQDLQSDGPNEAVEWLHCGTGKKTVLSGNRRTRDAMLLQAAEELRSARDCGDILHRAVMSARNANVAAAHIARTICWKHPKDLVILTPTGPDRSPFIRDAVARLTSKPIKPERIGKCVGPFNIVWESNVEQDRATVLEKLGTAVEIDLSGLQQTCSGDRGALGDVLEWAERKFKIKGQTRFSREEVTTAVDRVLQSRRAFLPPDARHIRAMTINQAKNREFQAVIVLWPFALGGDLESQRRRLYNALTRAQEWVVVIVQDHADKTSRLKLPPFSKTKN